MLSTIALLTAIVGFSVWHYVRGGYVLQLGVYFNVCAAAYMLCGMALARFLMELPETDELALIGWMSVAAVVGFNIAYLLANFGGARTSIRSSDYLPSHATILVVVAVGFAFEAAAVLLIGPLEFLFSERVERFGLMRPRAALFYLANLINICLPIAFARYLRYERQPDLMLLGILIAHSLVFSMVTISRYDLAILLLIGGYFLERHGRIRPAALVAILAVAFVSTLFYKPVLYSVILGYDYKADVDFGEYTNWIRHTLLLLASPNVEMPGNSYTLALKSLVVIRPEEDALSEWFMKQFFLERNLLHPQIGYGFTGVWEGYSANGLIGVAMHFAAFGAFFGLLERSPTAMRQIFIVLAMVLTYRLFRSEAYNFVKTFAWYFAYPTIAIVIADKFLVWASRAKLTSVGSQARGLRGRPPSA